MNGMEFAIYTHVESKLCPKPIAGGLLMKNTLITSLVLCFSFQSCCTEISRAGRLNDTQRKDLFETGQITDDESNLWNVRIIPRTDKIGEDFDEVWTDIGDIMGDFLEEEYYTDELGEAIDVGLEFAEKSVTEFWWDGCRDDIQAMNIRETASRL